MLTTHAQSRKKATWFFRLLVRCLMGFNIYVLNCFVATFFWHQPQRPLERFGIDTSIDQNWMQKIWLEVDIMEILLCFFAVFLHGWDQHDWTGFFRMITTARNLQGMLLCQLGCVQLPGVWGTQKNRMEEGMGVLRGFKGMMGDGGNTSFVMYILCCFFFGYRSPSQIFVHVHIT